ncbi:MAG: hypothetical protein WDZ69_02175 [Candidatus Pacearchaeota archaeon]
MDEKREIYNQARKITYNLLGENKGHVILLHPVLCLAYENMRVNGGDLDLAHRDANDLASRIIDDLVLEEMVKEIKFNDSSKAPINHPYGFYRILDNVRD